MARSGGWRTQAAAIVAAMILLASPARAGCNPSDIFNAAEETVSGLSACASACGNEASCAAALWLTAALTGVRTEGGQDKVNSFCNQAQGSASQIADKLQAVAGAAVAKQLASKLESVSSVGDIVNCACKTEQGGGSLDADFGQCVEDALCWVQEEIGLGSCDCTRPAPAIANCAAFDAKKCEADRSSSGLYAPPSCIPSGSIGNDNANCLPKSYQSWKYTVTCTTTSAGTLVADLPPTGEGTGCDGAYYCFCPAPMIPAWHQVSNSDGDSGYSFSCDCPYDPNNPDHQTHPGALMPNGISLCLCDNTNQPANFGFAPFGMCPPPACPAGQTRLGGVGDCVTPCSDPSQGMAFDGSCCNPAQMTSCGECCPPTTMPDPKSGTCVTRQQPK